MTSPFRILVATDLSPPSLHAVQRGLQLAQAAAAQCTVLHALELDALDALRDMLHGDTTDLARKITEEARLRLTQIVQDPLRHPGVNASIHVAPQSALAAVPAQADALPADLVVLGARGNGFLRHLLPGATASNLLRKLNRPALVVKQSPHGPYRQALVAVDFSPASERTLRVAQEVAPQAGMVLLHTVDLPFEGKLHYAGVSRDTIDHYLIEARERALARLHTLAAEAGLSGSGYHAIVVHGDAAQQIALLEQEHDCDLIVMGKHGTHATEDLLLGSVTERVLEASQADVLVVVEPPPFAR